MNLKDQTGNGLNAGYVTTDAYHTLTKDHVLSGKSNAFS